MTSPMLQCGPAIDGRVLVTGGSGFIGSHLVQRLLSQGVAVTCLRHKTPLDETAEKADVVDADLSDMRSVEAAMAGISTVFHLAGIAAAHAADACPAEAFRINTLGALNLLEAAHRSDRVRVILVSSSHVFGQPRHLPITEDHPVAPMSVYAATKLAADVMAAGYYRSFGLHVTALRLFNVYGPGQATMAVIPEIIRQALTRGRVQMKALHPRRDFLYVDDAVEAIVRTAATPAAIGQEIILASGRAVSIAELIRRVTTLTSGVVAHQPFDPDDNGDCLFGSTSRASKLLGWQPAVDLDTGLARTIAWWKTRLQAQAGRVSGQR